VKAWLVVPPGVVSGQELEVTAELELYGERRLRVRIDVV
jgi:hypothetical protein